MLRCLGFSVACWDFQLLVVCGRWLEAKPAALQSRGCLYSFESEPPEVGRHNSNASRTSVLEEKQPCPAPGGLLDFRGLSWDSTGV